MDVISRSATDHAMGRLRLRRWSLCKRSLDFVCSVAMLPMLIIPLLCIAIIIKLDSPGPILFRQRRRGLNGTYFACFKFRTMYAHLTDQDALQQSRPGDPRITRVGRFLRRTSLDELAQIYNVIRGDMSLVGPRPHAAGTCINDQLLMEICSSYMLRYHVKPGITGLAQINGLRGILDTEEKLHRRVEYDLRYIREWSLWLDIKILIRTVFCVLWQKAH